MIYKIILQKKSELIIIAGDEEYAPKAFNNYRDKKSLLIIQKESNVSKVKVFRHIFLSKKRMHYDYTTIFEVQDIELNDQHLEELIELHEKFINDQKSDEEQVYLEKLQNYDVRHQNKD